MSRIKLQPAFRRAVIFQLVKDVLPYSARRADKGTASGVEKVSQGADPVIRVEIEYTLTCEEKRDL